jgi:phosphodiesterase/alkaline phosphatase D-like protein
MSTILVLAVLGLQPTTASAQTGFSLGVASGDVTDDSAVLWTRSDHEAGLRLEVATDADFEQLFLTTTVTTASEQDYTAKVDAGGLQPATEYYYRFVDEGDPQRRSRPGRFRTAPPENTEASFRFILSGDSNSAMAPWHLMDFARRENADFFLWCGDIIYGDLSHEGSPPATDLAGYRRKYREAHTELRMQELLARVPLWCAWDDHEVTDDYDGGEPAPGLTRERIRQAYTAFFEYLPIRPQVVAGDEFRTYRSFRYGKLAEFFVVDGRQYRDAQIDCPDNLDPYGLLIGEADQDCVDQLEAPGRTMLGDEQFEWLINGLAGSTARYKFIINNVPFTSIVVETYDHWDSYDDERRALLEFIDAAGIAGVYSLVTEVHANIYNPDVTSFFRQYRPSYDFSDTFTLPEFIVGPIAAHTLQQAAAGRLYQYVPPDTLFGQLLSTAGFDAGLQLIGNLNTWAFAEPNRYAYLLVEVGPDGPTFTYRGVDAESSRPTLQALYTVGPAGPPCMGFSILMVMPAAALLARAMVLTNRRRHDRTHSQCR